MDIHWGVVYNVLILLAILTGPIAAVQIQKWLDDHRAKKERKMTIFQTLMKTRATPLSWSHVEALNMIDIEFYGKEGKEVVEAWKSLLYNFTQFPQDATANDYKTKYDESTKKSKELLATLLSKMAKVLKYEFDDVHLKRDIYRPEGHAEIESNQLILLNQFTEILKGNKAFPIKIIDSDKVIASKNKPQQLKIIKATYYSVNKAIDVTDNLNNKIVDNRLRLKVNNDIDYDPDPGVSKKLKIEYLKNGEKTISVFDERTEIDLP